jgi:hemerythrin-like metal-binding protein
MTVRWSPDLAIDDSQIDFQHRQLLDAMCDLETAIARGDRRLIAETAGFLDQYAIVHFADEERACELAGWEGLSGHRALHAVFRARLSSLHDALGRGDLAAGREALGFLAEWLIGHIRGSDRQFAPAVRALRARAAAPPPAPSP